MAWSLCTPLVFLSLHPTGKHFKEIGSEDENWTELSRTRSKQGEFTDTIMNLLPQTLRQQTNDQYRSYDRQPPNIILSQFYPLPISI